MAHGSTRVNGTLRCLNLRRIPAISMGTRYGAVHRNSIMGARNRARFMQPRHFPVLYRNKYLDSVCTSPKKIRYDSIFLLPRPPRRRRLGFLARRKSAARGRKTDVSSIICESPPSLSSPSILASWETHPPEKFPLKRDCNYEAISLISRKNLKAARRNVRFLEKSPQAKNISARFFSYASR